MSALVGAAQQALDVLLQALDAQSNPARREFPTIHDFGQMRRAADTLKAALVPHECTCPAKDMPFGRCCKAQAEPTAWIEHHKGGDNLCWEDPGGTKTPLYATPQRVTRPTPNQLLALRRSLPMEAGDVEFAFAVLATYGVTK